MNAITSPPFPIAVIGGSGLYALEALEEVREISLETPFGAPSDKIVAGKLQGTQMYFLPRHGKNHQCNPSQVNYRANIFALKSLGVEWCLSVSAVGSLCEEMAPGDIVIPNQLIDRTRGRFGTFFDEGIVAHIAFADPYCTTLKKIVSECASRVCKAHGTNLHQSATYLCMEGPAFSTRAESQLYRSWGAQLIGMTNSPEAKLAREAEMAYATIALVTDYDCWKQDGHDVDAAIIIERLKRMTTLAKEIIVETAKRLTEEPLSSYASTALKNALLTDLKQASQETLERLEPLLEKYL